jgi:hypothetical protein
VAVVLLGGVGVLVFTEDPGAPSAVVEIAQPDKTAEPEAGPPEASAEAPAAAEDAAPSGTGQEGEAAEPASVAAPDQPPAPAETASPAPSEPQPAQRQSTAATQPQSPEPASPESVEAQSAQFAAPESGVRAEAPEGGSEASVGAEDRVTISVKKRSPAETQQAAVPADDLGGASQAAAPDAPTGQSSAGTQPSADSQAVTGGEAGSGSETGTSDAATVAPSAPEATAQSAAEGQPAAQPAMPAPSFDIVRVEPSGETVVAGRAGAGAEVSLVDGEREIGTAKANARGEFVILLDEPLSPATHELGLAAKSPDGTAAVSDDVVVVVVPERAETAPSGGAAEGVVALLTPRGDGGGSQVLQRPGEAEAVPLSIDVIDYDATGMVTVGGRAEPQTILQVYLNDALAGRGQAREDGVFSLRLEAPVSVGEHSIRIDQTGADGKVMARAEAPFSRTAIAAELPEGKFVVVQPGNSLWRIARRTYGDGVRYTVIFGANNRQIRDPDLIYPGQIFIVPQRDGGTG